MPEVQKLDTERANRGGTDTPGVDNARLQIVLGREAMTSLKEIAGRKGINVSEAVRRAVSLWEYTERAMDRGATLATIEDENGKTKIREVVLL
ncbi:ribbon-helix-helix protein, CopG family [Kribbella sindirgiensis]|nr:ribbon-helix-helix protein, CopG family [Kribbella sindirgiensis]